MSVSRHTRYSGILPIERLTNTPVTIIGVGATGLQVARTLATMGVLDFNLYDPDVVSVENLGTQGWHPADIDQPKVVAARYYLRAINPDTSILAFNDEFTENDAQNRMHSAVFLCVDSITARKDIWTWFKKCDSLEFFCDSRMGSETCRIIAGGVDQMPDFEGTFFDESEAEEETCTTRSTYYCAAINASLMVSRYAMWLREKPFEFDINFNITEDLLIPASAGSLA